MRGKRRREDAGPVGLARIQELGGRLFPDAGYRHVGEPAWNRCLALDSPVECPTAAWDDGTGGGSIDLADFLAAAGLGLAVDAEVS
ncbi:hypothetical protein [Kitasatospora sp. NPDC093558]|uniref:hypothetical protein n=1 Tax=Kitasatospora sp. NPDC093558 TaxID=3155201 RepID=UPI0034237912